jgi:tetrahydromethanopterin S-methyltransferase subunit G
MQEDRMPEKTEKKSTAADLEHTKKRLEMLDKRLDNIDSVVTALVERVMRQPVTIEVTCPKCGSVVQIMLTSNTKTTGKG